MKTKAPKEPVKAVNLFQCPNCKDSPEFDGVEPFKEHLKTAHAITELKGKRQMTMHMDCSDHYTSNYELEIGGLKFYQFTVNPRRFGMLSHGM